MLLLMPPAMVESQELFWMLLREKGIGSYARTRPRRVHDPAEHRHETRAGAPREIPASCRGAQEEDWFPGPVLHRAEAERTDQAPIRFRRCCMPTSSGNLICCPISS